MPPLTADIVICGAGIAGVAAAYHLAVRRGFRDILLVDERPPLSLTSDKSTECYRNWWPGPGDAMIRLMNRSIDIMEELAGESGNTFHMNRRGYLFATADPLRVPVFQKAAEEAAGLGSGAVRFHPGQPGDPGYIPAPPQGYKGQPIGSDLITDRKLIRENFPYLSQDTVALIHPRRCGWVSAQQLGMYLLERAKDKGVRFYPAGVVGVQQAGERVKTVRLKNGNSIETVSTRLFVNAAGPFVKNVAAMMGVDLPVFHELHVKIAFRDPLRIIPREAPLLIWTDPAVLPWSEEERSALDQADETRYLLKEFPSGVHARPEGGAGSDTVLILWTYDVKPVDPVFPFSVDPHYPEIALRGLSLMIPGLRAYFGRMAKPVVDGGYYTKTRENRPLIGPLPVEGTYIIGGLSGFGVMAACGAGELLAASIAGDDLPAHAAAFSLARYEDPEYRTLLANWGETGQL